VVRRVAKIMIAIRISIRVNPACPLKNRRSGESEKGSVGVPEKCNNWLVLLHFSSAPFLQRSILPYLQMLFNLCMIIKTLYRSEKTCLSSPGHKPV